jgi:small subunit ribosomal protein S14
MVARYAAKRTELRTAAVDMTRSPEQRADARTALASLPLNSNAVRYRNRCALTGRPRAYIRYFGLSRITFRGLALEGKLPGVRKASW